MARVSMVANIMADWQSARFFIAPDYIVADMDTPHLIVLTELKFWAEHAEQLAAWCETHGATVAGMTVEIPDDQTLSLFVLRWS